MLCRGPVFFAVGMYKIISPLCDNQAWHKYQLIYYCVSKKEWVRVAIFDNVSVIFYVFIFYLMRLLPWAVCVRK